MDILGSIGQLYTFILLVLLVLGSGLAVYAFISNAKSEKKAPANINNKQNQQTSIMNKTSKKIITLGGIFMKNNGWFKLAAFSFAGILISAVILGFTSNSNPNNMNMQGMNNVNMQGVSNTSMQNGSNGMNMQGNVNMVGRVNAQGNMNMNGMSNTQGSMNMSGMSNAQSSTNMQGMGSNDIQQQMYMMQMQLNQMQQQLMNMMNGNMNNMQQNSGNSSNMNNMQQNNSNSGSMPMM